MVDSRCAIVKVVRPEAVLNPPPPPMQHVQIERGGCLSTGGMSCTLHEEVQCILYNSFRLVVQGRGGFVEPQDRRRLEQRWTTTQLSGKKGLSRSRRRQRRRRCKNSQIRRENGYGAPRAMAIRCFCPPESCAPRSPTCRVQDQQTLLSANLRHWHHLRVQAWVSPPQSRGPQASSE